jgi:hypothetical protein
VNQYVDQSVDLRATLGSLGRPRPGLARAIDADATFASYDA